MENFVRLNKFIAANGISSRRKIDEMISQGRITVNGNTVVELGYKIDPEKDKVALDGENIKTSTKKIYIILNKPQGVVTTVSDDKHRTTVIDLIKISEKIFPVGRLDYNTTGLLLLTNDGELANKLMHPKSEVYKTYFVTLSKPLEEKHRLKLEGGVKLEGKKTAHCKIRFEKKSDYQSLFISIYEGRNRQVRKMFEHYGYFVRELERTEYAGLHLDGLRPGEWRKLTIEEVDKVKGIIKETPADNPKSARFYKPDFKPKESKRDKYNKKDPKKDFRKFDKKNDNGDVKRDFKKADKPSKKSLKWGFKSRQIEERDIKLGFKKADQSDGRSEERKDYKKSGERDYRGRFPKSFKRSDSRADGNNEKRNFKSYDSKDEGKDIKRDYKKYGKKDDTKDVKRNFKKYDNKDKDKGVKRGFKKYGSKEEGKDVKRTFKNYDNKEEDKGVKRGFKKFGSKEESKDLKRNFKKDGKKNFKKRF